MNKKFIKTAFAVAIAMIAGVNVFNAQKTVVLSDVAMANVEALADNEYGDREDCEEANDLCPLLVIYPDGDYGEEIVFGKKKPGWL